MVIYSPFLRLVFRWSASAIILLFSDSSSLDIAELFYG
jgi:hypothetical protein